MAQTHTVISGSFTLQFMDGSYYPNSNLDLYILPNDTLLILGAYLLYQGYIYTRQEWQLEDFLEDAQHILATLDVIPNIEDNNKPNYRSKCICTVYTFQHHVTDDDVRSIQVVVPRVSPLSCILVFHSTCVMNIITYNATFSLYLYATFNCRESLTLDVTMHPAEVRDKYAKRGWTMLENPSSACTPHTSTFLSSPPYPKWFAVGLDQGISDCYSWVMHLDTTGVVTPLSFSLLAFNLGWDPITARGWKLGTHFSYSTEIVVETPGINLYLSPSPYTPTNFCHILPFLLPPGSLEKVALDDNPSEDQVLKTIAWWDIVVPAMRELYDVGWQF